LFKVADFGVDRNRPLTGLCTQTVQLHSTTLTLTLDALKLKDAVATIVPWKTFTSILEFYALLLEGKHAV